jgi:hypothetical protein
MTLLGLSKQRAKRLHRQAQARSADGDDDAALELYRQCLALDPTRASSLYNIGLIYKYRSDWEKSFEFNAKAYELAPTDAASRWNLAIAATALRRWRVARQAWRDNGWDLADSDEPIRMDFGHTPVRLHPHLGADANAPAHAGEVVWGSRIDPVRVVIDSIPFPNSGFRCGDVVLHDGAAVGARVVNGREYPVFNVLALFEASTLSTYVAHVQGMTPEHIDWLQQLAGATGVTIEDWTGNVRTLCKLCSEGIPHSAHDTAGETVWNAERTIGLACAAPEQIDRIMSACKEKAAFDISRITLELNA